MLIFLADWASQVNFRGPVDEQLDLISTLREQYLFSDYANDREERGQMLMLLDHIESLFEELEKFSMEDYRKMDEWILKLNQEILKLVS